MLTLDDECQLLPPHSYSSSLPSSDERHAQEFSTPVFRQRLSFTRASLHSFRATVCTRHRNLLAPPALKLAPALPQHLHQKKHHARNQFASARGIPSRLLHERSSCPATWAACWPSAYPLFLPSVERCGKTPRAGLRVLSCLRPTTAWHLVQNRSRAIQQVTLVCARIIPILAFAFQRDPALLPSYRTDKRQLKVFKCRQPASISTAYRQALTTQPHRGTKTWSNLWVQLSPPTRK